MKKKLSLLLAVIMVVSLLSACGAKKDDSAANTPAPAPGAQATVDESSKADASEISTAKAGADKCVNLAISENCITLDPHNLNNVGSGCIVEPVYEPLLLTDQRGNFWPYLAESWEHNEDGTEWTFKIRDGIYFTNGDKLCADDVVCTYQRLIDDYDALCYGVSNFPGRINKSVEKIDDMTVKMTFTETYALIQGAFANIGIIPHTVYEQMGAEMFYQQKLVATGPWKLTEWVDGQYGHYVKNENYWNKANYDPYYEEMYIRHVLESSTGVASHLAGDIDANIVAGGINPDMLALYAGTEKDIELFNVNVTSYYYLGFQCGKDSVFNDVDVRKAFEMAIDRQAILDAIMGGGQVCKSIVPKGVLGYDEDLEGYEYNPEKAAELLKNSTYDGRAIKLSSNTSTTKAEEQLLAISDMVNAVGFNSSIEIVENATLLSMRKEGAYDVFLVITMHGSGEALGICQMRILEDCHTSQFVDDELNGYIKQAGLTVDTAAREELYKKAMVRLREVSAPHTGLYAPNAVEAVSYGVKGLRFYEGGTFLLRYVDYDANSTGFEEVDYEQIVKGL